jgi:hypothetical protein
VRLRRWAIVLVAAGAVLGLRATDPNPTILPLISVPQGVTLHQVGDVPVFLSRQGNILRGFIGRSTSSEGGTVVYCPAENVFVAPFDTSLWTSRGEWVAGPAHTDLHQVTVSFNIDLNVRINTRKVIRARTRSEGEVGGDIGDRYARFRAGDGFVRFCQNSVPPVPGAVPTPTPS